MFHCWCLITKMSTIIGDTRVNHSNPNHIISCQLPYVQESVWPFITCVARIVSLLSLSLAILLQPYRFILFFQHMSLVQYLCVLVFITVTCSLFPQIVEVLQSLRFSPRVRRSAPNTLLPLFSRTCGSTSRDGQKTKITDCFIVFMIPVMTIQCTY